MSARKSNYKSSKVKDNFGDEESPPSPPSNVEQNPFSFKQFISNPTKELTPELPLSSKATKIKPIATPIPVELTDALADALADQTIKKSNEKNPFSFKHFISSAEPTVAIPPPPPQSTLVCDVSFSPPTPSANFLPSHSDFITAPEHLIDNCQALPDFINESLLKKIDESTINNNQIPSYFDLETNLNEVQTPDETIKVLKKALKEKQQTINEQSDRISQLEKRIVNLKQNEANENKALEDMIQHVEENLVKTTKRAVESERSADKMKQDIKQLKTQVFNNWKLDLTISILIDQY